MPGIASNTTSQLRDRIHRFATKYVRDWDEWLLRTPESEIEDFGRVLRKWQACRPNAMRRSANCNLHGAPFLEDLVQEAHSHLANLKDFNIGERACFTTHASKNLSALWDIFVRLSYGGRARGGLSGVVGISKAVLLLTNGRVGPAFDSRVRENLQIDAIDSDEAWIEALQTVCNDICEFEARNGIAIVKVAPNYSHLEVGRIYDMALGPGA